MVSDSISNPTVTALAGNAKDLARKKRTNRSAKLKQCKLDARREQWLSKVKNKGLKVEGNGDREPSVLARNEGNHPIENLGMQNNQHESDWDSPSNSPTCGSSVLGSNEGSNFTGSSIGSSSRSSSSTGCWSGSISEEEEDDGCLDDWETVADALAADDKQQSSALDPVDVNASIPQLDSAHELANQKGSRAEVKLERVTRAQENGQAWRPDDAFRPQSLPNLTKQRSFPMKSDRHYGRGGAGMWNCKSTRTVPSSCPICCEDLDMTDTSFLPCPCGFRLCLFCHKRILEEDGRCPGCRKSYDQEHVEVDASVMGGNLTFRLARSCSMIPRS